MTAMGFLGYLRGVLVVLSLVNVLAAYLEKAAVGKPSLAGAMADHDVRTRLWISVVALAILGVGTLVYLVAKALDHTLDFQSGSGRTKMLALIFGLVELSVAGGLTVLLVVFP